MNNVTKVTTTAERIVALMSQPTYDIYGMFISHTKSFSPSALKKAMRIVPIAEIRTTIEALCEQGLVKPNGVVLPMFGAKREAIYTVTTEKEENQ